MPDFRLPVLDLPRRARAWLPVVLLLLTAGGARAQRPGTGFEVHEAPVAALQEALSRGETTSVELVDAYLARIAAYDAAGPRLNAILRVNPDARADAARLDRERAERGPRGPLHGIPVILKDNFDAVGLATSAGSIALAGTIPPDDAFQVRRLREAGAIVLAKSNLHELAAGITTVSSLGGQTLNPYDPARNPGGSSGGTAAAVAASFAALGWGTDTCGSIRIPAAVNHLVGLRPTKGLSSIDGIVPLSHSQDVAGPLARSVADLAAGLDATVGPDPADPATRLLEGRPVPRFAEALDADALRGRRIGVLGSMFGDDAAERETTAVVRAALETMRERGAEVVEVEIPGLDSLVEGTSVIALELKWDLMDYLAATPGAPVASLGEILERGLYHRELEERLRARNQVAARRTPALDSAMARRAALRDRVLRTMEAERLDALAYPTMRRPAARVGEPALGANCQLSAATGTPAVSVPAGFTEAGLPVGLELLGPPLSDARLVGFAYALEQAVRPRRPPPLTPPLHGGTAPAPGRAQAVATPAQVVPAASSAASARASFSLDPARGSLRFRVAVSGVSAEQVHAVALHRGAPGESGPVLQRLLGPGAASGEGEVALSPADHEALRAGELFFQVYTRDHPGGAARGRVMLPAPDAPSAPRPR